MPTKPAEELYDTLADPHEIENLVDSAQHAGTLRRLRAALRQWMLRTRDTGLLPEAEMHIRAEGSTPYEMAQSSRKYAQRRILAAADLVGRGPQNIPKLVNLLDASDSAVRYWGIIGLTAVGREAEPAADALAALLEDPAPNVRFAAAGTLCSLDLCENALPVLAAGLEDKREETVLYAARELQSIGDKARPVLQQMEDARAKYLKADGSPINGNHAMFIDWALMHAIENCQE
jgi:uncharacterized sulfatase